MHDLEIVEFEGGAQGFCSCCLWSRRCADGRSVVRDARGSTYDMTTYVWTGRGHVEAQHRLHLAARKVAAA